jgi:MFS family permease
MTAEAREQIRQSVAALAGVFHNPNLRRLELAWAGSITGDWAFVVALNVFAFQEGGAAAVGLLGLIRFLPAAIMAPFSGVIADRLPRERVMLGTDLIRALAMGGVALAVVDDAPVGVVYALAGLIAVVSTAFPPAQSAVLPTLARTPEELTTANVASSTIESVGSFIGPALGGILLAATGTGVVFAFTAGAFLWSALLLSRIRAPRGERSEEHVSVGRHALAGFRTILGTPDLRLVVGLYAAQTLVAGALNVIIVVTAFELLDLGESGPGYLNSAIGVGGLVGAAFALALAGRRRLAGDFGAGLVLWGLPILLIAAWPVTPATLVFLGLLGIGNTVVDVAALTLLQRTVPGEVLARVFGVLESLVVATLGLGAVLSSVLISAIGIRPALVATGALLPVLAVLARTRLRRIDERADVPEEELALLRTLPLFAPLPAPVLEHLARRLESVSFPAGTEIVREGDAGDRFYIVSSGRLEVSTAGGPLRSLGPGDWFGEIALLRDVPRTATVAAASDVTLFSLERDEFVGAVTGHPASVEAADAVVAARLGAVRPGMASL